MPVIESRVEVSAPIERVMDIARRVEEFPEFMPDLKSLVVLERSEDGLRTVTEWVGMVREFKMTVRWTEEDIWDPGERTCRFRMVKGDLTKYEGTWTFEETASGTVFSSVIDFEYNVPLVGPLILNIITAKMRQNADNILKAIKEKAEGS